MHAKEKTVGAAVGIQKNRVFRRRAKGSPLFLSENLEKPFTGKKECAIIKVLILGRNFYEKVGLYNFGALCFESLRL